MTDDTGCDDDKIWRGVPVSALRAALAPPMTDVETELLGEELAKIAAPFLRPAALMCGADSIIADAILPIIARERATALSAATPGIEARVRGEVAAELPQLMQDEWGEICSDTGCHPLDIHRDPQTRNTWFTPGHWVEAIAAAIRKG